MSWTLERWTLYTVHFTFYVLQLSYPPSKCYEFSTHTFLEILVINLCKLSELGTRYNWRDNLAHATTCATTGATIWHSFKANKGHLSHYRSIWCRVETTFWYLQGRKKFVFYSVSHKRCVFACREVKELSRDQLCQIVGITINYRKLLVNKKSFFYRGRGNCQVISCGNFFVSSNNLLPVDKDSGHVEKYIYRTQLELLNHQQWPSSRDWCQL